MPKNIPQIKIKKIFPPTNLDLPIQPQIDIPEAVYEQRLFGLDAEIRALNSEIGILKSITRILIDEMLFLGKQADVAHLLNQIFVLEQEYQKIKDLQQEELV